MLLLKRSTIKEFKSSREKIDDNTLSKTLKKLINNGYIEVLDISLNPIINRYIASSKGLSVLPLLMELYLFSCNEFDEATLSPLEINFKKDATQNSALLKDTIIKEYHNFTQELKTVSVLN